MVPNVTIAVARISEDSRTIRVRIGPALLAISGDARELLDAEIVESEIRGLDRENAICALIGLGFRQLGIARKWRDEASGAAGVGAEPT